MKLKTGPWNLTDLKKIKKNGYTVFSCFHCGGGSTMGYKLSGFDVIGGVEIDPKMMSVYKANHSPKYPYLMGVGEFNKIPNEDLPKELFELDVLDGSPPCSSFSMSGSREKAWGKNKKFREGQTEQILDDLFFDFIETAKKLKPKIVVAENVKGLLMGKAKGYVKQISQQFNKAGYDVQLFLLNSAFMGAPQRRERTFFVARRKDLRLDDLNLVFKENPISAKAAIENCNLDGINKLTENQMKWWKMCLPGKPFSSVHPKGSWFNSIKLSPSQTPNTVCASASRSASGLYHWSEPRQFSPREYGRFQTFPDDYMADSKLLVYICGMSVPPYMMNRVSLEVKRQLLDKIK